MDTSQSPAPPSPASERTDAITTNQPLTAEHFQANRLTQEAAAIAERVQAEQAVVQPVEMTPEASQVQPPQANQANPDINSPAAQVPAPAQAETTASQTAAGVTELVVSQEKTNLIARTARQARSGSMAAVVSLEQSIGD